MIIVAGPNGAGKTSFASRYLEAPFSSYAYVNADEIARDLTAAGRASTSIEIAAGRRMLRLLDELVEARRDFMFETTLASLHYRKKLRHWREMGHSIAIVYLSLPTAEHAVERVARRVAAGGHGIPEDTIRQRFHRSWDYFNRYYKALTDEWYVWESREGEFVPVEAWDQ